MYNKIDNFDRQTFENLAYQLFGITFKKNHCVEYKSIKIQDNPNTGLWLKNFSGKHEIPDNINAYGMYKMLSGEDKEKYKNLPKKKPQTPPKPKEKKTQLKPKTKRIDFYSFLYEHLNTKTGADIELLEKYNVQQCTELYGIAQHNQIAYITDNGTKYKRPFATAKNKYRTHKTENEYCFGLAQLPPHCNTILIVEGEDDTLCINSNLNKYGVFAVNLWSATTAPSKELIKELRGKCENLFFFYDNDDTGTAQSEKFGAQHGVQCVDVNFLFHRLPLLYVLKKDANDICDIYQNAPTHCAPEILHDVIKQGIEQTAQIKKDKDVFSVGVQSVLRCNFNQYLSEQKPLEFLLYALAIKKRIIVQSAAGTGKSFCISEIALNIDDSSRGLIVFTPTVSITEQLTNTLKENLKDDNLSVVGFWGNADKVDIETAKESTIIVATYDKAMMLKEHIDFTDYVGVFDEYHQFVNDLSYRDTAMQSVYKTMCSFEYCILMSATPNLLFTQSDLNPNFDFKLCQFIPRKTNTITVQPYAHKMTKSEILGCIEDYRPTNKKGGVHFVKYDNNTELESFMQLAIERGATVEHLTSQDTKKREQNETYREIMSTGKLPKDLDFLVSTTLLEAGVSFKFNVGCVSLLDVQSYTRAIQLSTRARLQTDDTNKDVFVNLFFKENEDKEKPTYTNCIISQYEQLYTRAERQVQRLKAMPKREQKVYIKRAKIDIDLWVLENEHGQFEVDVLAILHELYTRECSTNTPELMKLRINRLDNRFIFLDTKNAQQIDTELKDLIDDVRESNDKCNAMFEDLLYNEPNEVLRAIYTKSKNKELRERIKGVLGVVGISRSESLEYISKNTECFKTRLHHKVARGVCSLIENGYSLQGAINLYRIEGAKGVQVQNDLHTIRNRKRAQKRGTISRVDALQLNIYKAIQKKFKRIGEKQRAQKRGALSSAEICTHILRAMQDIKLPKLPSNKQCLEYFKMCFEVEQKRTKKQTLYTILGVKRTKLRV